MTPKSQVSLAIILTVSLSVLAQDARVRVKVSPPEAYVFLDGTAIRDGHTVLKTAPGEHTIAVYNYGFRGEERKVVLQAGKNDAQRFELERSGEDISSPYGYIQIEGPGRAAVLLNGATPDYLVGHVDEFNNHIIWSQQLIVPPGTHQLIVTRLGKTIYSGPVEVAAGRRVIVNVKKNTTRTQNVDNGSGLSRPRFKAGTASAAVVIAPVSGNFAAKPGQIDCNQTTQLAYNSVETLHSSIHDGTDTKQLPAATGEVPVSPRQTTTYTFEASGPGGIVKQDATVNVNPVIQSSLEASQPEVHYLKVGEKVLVQGSTDLKWTVNNADKVAVDPLGDVSATAPGTTTGQQKLAPEPGPSTGNVNETKTYTLTASNVCGGADTKTAQVRITGMIQPYILSVFFPTAAPTREQPDKGLIASQQETLSTMAKAYKLYAEQTSDARLVIHGYADPRGTTESNAKLSERRVAAVKAFLVGQGVPEDKISFEALGESSQLDSGAVQKLEAENPFKSGVTEEDKDQQAIQLAYNRRIDMELQPADVETARFFPYQASDAVALLSPHGPGRQASGTAVAAVATRRKPTAARPAVEMAREQSTETLPQSGSPLPLILAIGLSMIGISGLAKRYID